MVFIAHAVSIFLFPADRPRIITDQPEIGSTRRGVTLLDMVVTMLLVAIVSAVTVPRMADSFERHRLRSAASVLSGQLSYLQRQAIIRGQSLTVQLSSRPAALVCSQIDMPNQPGTLFRLDLSAEFQVDIMSWDGFEGTEIRFDRHGNTLTDQGKIDNWFIKLSSPTCGALLAITPNATDITVASR